MQLGHKVPISYNAPFSISITSINNRPSATLTTNTRPPWLRHTVTLRHFSTPLFLATDVTTTTTTIYIYINIDINIDTNTLTLGGRLDGDRRGVRILKYSG